MGNTNKGEAVVPPLPEHATVKKFTEASNNADKTADGQEENDGTKASVDIFKGGRYRIASPEATKAFYDQQPSRVNADILMPEQGITDMKQMKQYLSDTEGLNIGSKQLTELSQQWRFFLASDPVQHGLDAGFLLGSFTAVASSIKPQNRIPLRVFSFWMYGFAAGMMGFPMLCMGWEQYNMNRIMKTEKDMFKEQRKDFYQRVTKAGEEAPVAGPK